VKRRGFTLIELMVVIAIIIILAAIAIPNYLKMTERAKKSRVAADFGALALSLESYVTDWGTYPVMGANKFGKGADGAALTSTFAVEIGGTKGTAGTTDLPNGNAAVDVTATGEKGPIEYMKAGTLMSMANPFNGGWDYYYIGEVAGWGLYAQAKTGADPTVGKYLTRNSSQTTLLERSTAPTTVSNCGTAN
jgi:prepilin-type N-terminal cleavage/methylation domain-containing protein